MTDSVRPHRAGPSTSAKERAAQEQAEKQRRLAAFRDGDGKARDLTKAERDKLIAQQFPSTRGLDWGTALSNDTDLFARIMRDIIKLDQREPGKSGPRPNTMDIEQGMETFRQLMGEDYSLLPFNQAFQILSGSMSLTVLARKVYISRSKVRRLLLAEIEPSMLDMRKIADGFRKSPSYFVEYRRQAVVEYIANALLKAPESTVAFYNKISKGRNG